MAEAGVGKEHEGEDLQDQLHRTSPKAYTGQLP